MAYFTHKNKTLYRSLLHKNLSTLLYSFLVDLVQPKIYGWEKLKRLPIILAPGLEEKTLEDLLEQRVLS